MKPNESDLHLSRTWLTSLEVVARDMMGVMSRDFLRRVYRKAAEEWLTLQSRENSFHTHRVSSAVDAIKQYIESGASGGLLRASEDIEVREPEPGHISLTVHRCPYKTVCQSLIDSGLKTNELTCPRLGCLTGAISLLANKDANHELEEFQPHAHCRGTIITEAS